MSGGEQVRQTVVSGADVWRWGVMGLQGLSGMIRKTHEDSATGLCPDNWLAELKVYNQELERIIREQEAKRQTPKS